MFYCRKYNLAKNILTLVLVGFLALSPLSPVFVYAEEDPNPDGNNFSEAIQNDPAGYVEQVINNSEGSGFGPSADDAPEESADSGNNSENSVEPPDDGVPGPEGEPGPDNFDEEGDDGIPGPENEPGPTGSPGPGSSDDETPGTGFAPDPQAAVDSVLKKLDGLESARTLDEIQAWRDAHYDELSLSTEDVQGNVTDSIIDDNPSTLSENNSDSTDDSLINNNASSTDETVVDAENILEQENITTGEAVSGDNLLHSDKDVLQGKIDTGTSDINSQSENKGNTNDVSSGGGGSSGWIQKLWGSASNNANNTNDSVISNTAQEVKELTVLNKNLAFITNLKKLLAKSGGNTISGIGRVDESSIVTGHARAKSSLLNIINTNTVDSAFLPITFDIFENYTGNINIMQMLFEAFGAALNGPNAVTATAENNTNQSDDSVLNSSASVSDAVNVEFDNEGYINNDLDLAAVSGQNKALAGRKLKETFIQTGNSEVANNLINFLNTNLFKSKVGVVVINVFADWAGSLIIPDAGQLAADIPDPTGVSGGNNVNSNASDDSINNSLLVTNSDLSVVTADHGQINSNININANTGSNTTAFDDDAEDINIRTGQAKTLSSILTLANRSIVGTAFSQGFFQVMGDWTGTVLGTPDSAKVYQGQEGNFIISDEAAALVKGNAVASATSNANETDDSIINTSAEVNKAVSLNYNNLGRVDNKLNVLADSGTNSAAAYKGQKVDIDTGDASVANNIANFVNNNFAYSKGLVVALNVFGKWRGNVAYDELLDLSVDLGLLSAPSDIEPGSELIYNVAAINTGTEATAPGTLSFNFDPNKLELIDPDGGQTSGNTLTWPYDSLQGAEKAEFNPVFQVNGDLPDGEYNIPASVSTNQNDSNTQNNHLSRDVSFRVGDRDTGIQRERTLRSENTAPPNNDNSDNDSEGSETDNPDSSQGDGNDNNSEDSTSSDSSAENNNNNSDGNNGGSGNVNPGNSHTPGYLLAEKTVKQQGPFSPGDHVTYYIDIQNPGDTRVDDVVVYDTMINKGLEAESSWPIDYVDVGETVTVEYEIEINADVEPGDYTNTAYASGFDAANAVIRSNNSQVTVEIINPEYLPGAGEGGPGVGGFTVIDQFNSGATSTLTGNLADGYVDEDSVNPGQNNSEQGISADNDETNGAKTAVVEKDLEQQIKSTSVVSRYIPVVSAAEGIYLDEQGRVLGDNYESATPTDRLAYAVYPNFLQFDGRTDLAASSGQAEAGQGIFGNWLIWLFLALALILGYLSYREKQNRRSYKF